MALFFCKVYGRNAGTGGLIRIMRESIINGDALRVWRIIFTFKEERRVTFLLEISEGKKP